MIKILILTDSLGLPRLKPEICGYKKTWPILLKRKYANLMIHQTSIGGATSGDLLKQVHYCQAFEPDIAIVQVGIVDCAPRFMTRLELEIARKMSYLGKALIKMFNNKWVRRIRNISYTSINEFRNNIIELKFILNCPIIFVGIIPATIDYQELLPNIDTKIKDYNKVLSSQDNSSYISTDSLINGGLMVDHHHLNEDGHEYIYKKIDVHLISWLEMNKQ